ncbi:histidine phosphatase family protein [Lachnospiraceae bacterium 54-53]
MKLHIIRHGEPDYENDTLTPLGLKQAKALTNLPEIMAVRRVLSSPMGRAKETARPAAQAAGIPVEIIPWLREMDDVVVWDKKRPDLAVWNLPPQRLSPMESGSWLDEEIFCGTKLIRRWEELCAGADAFLAPYGIVRKNGGWSADGLEKDSLELAFFCHLGVGLTLTAYLLDVCPPA